MSRIYIYPKHDYAELESPNPYMLKIEAALSEKHKIVNQIPNRKGILDFFGYLFKTDVYFLNWIEDIPVRRYGLLQVIILRLFLILAGITKKRIVWVLHNKFSHEKKKQRLIRYVFKLMMKYSDLIFTHSQEGVEFVKAQFPYSLSKTRYILHPIDETLISNSEVKEYDFLIWGTIYPYKGVIEFLDFVYRTPAFRELKILVAGICINDNLREGVKKRISDNINYLDKFLNIEEISVLAARSRFVLFTYNSDSVLSSGSLMDSIRMGSIIIGPDKGSFHDLKNCSFIETYTIFDEIISIYNRRRNEAGNHIPEVLRFCSENSWDKFAEKLFSAGTGII